jgi:hypothetical protein
MEMLNFATVWAQIHGTWKTSKCFNKLIWSVTGGKQVCIYIADNMYTIHKHTFLHASHKYLLNLMKFTEHLTVVIDSQ